MARRAKLQNAFTKGEIDPDLSERLDMEHYYASAANALNTIFHPQGGASDRGGFALLSDADILALGGDRRLRYAVRPVTLSSGMITAANGGVAANLVDQVSGTLFTTNAVLADPFVLFEVDLGVAQDVVFFDVEQFRAGTAGLNNALSVQYWDGAAWQTFGDAPDVSQVKHIRTSTRTRRFGMMPGGHVSARQWRAVIVGGSGVVGQVTIAGIRMWTETAKLSPVRVRELARSDDDSYEMVFTEQNIDVFARQRYLASIPMPVPAQQIKELTFTGGIDTMFVFHEQVPTRQITRQGEPGEWNVEIPGWLHIPALFDNIIFSGDQNEIQDIALPGLVAGQTFLLFLDGQATAPITFSDNASLPGQIVSALGALGGVASGGADFVATLRDATPTVRIEFAGSNGLRSWALVAAAGLTATALEPLTTVVQQGTTTGGTVFGATTGWPRAGARVQQRLLLAGFRSAPTAYAFSRSGSLVDFENTGSPLTADLGLVRALDVDEVETILDVFVGRHVQFFTETGEWFGEDRTVDATKPFTMTRATGHGIKKGVPITFVDGATLFVQKGGQTLRDFLWVDVEQNYRADPLTVLAPHLLANVTGVAHRAARDVREGNQVLLVNGDGSASMLTLLRSQEVIALAPWETDGAFRDAMSNIRHEMYAAIERDGALYLEKWQPDLPLDWATHFTGSGLTEVSVPYLDGRTDVWAIVDDELAGPLTVTDDTLVLPAAADDVWVGLAPAWRLRLPVVRERLQQAQPFRPPGRIYEVELSLRDTGQITVATNGQAHQDVPLVRFGDRFENGGPLQTANGGAPQLPMYQRLYTGDVRASGLLGWSHHPYIEIARTVPAPVHVKAVRYEVAYSG